MAQSETIVSVILFEKRKKIYIYQRTIIDHWSLTSQPMSNTLNENARTELINK